MTQSSVLIGIGIFVALLPFLGLPYSFLDALIPLLGIVVFGIGLANRLHDIRGREAQKPSHNVIMH